MKKRCLFLIVLMVLYVFFQIIIRNINHRITYRINNNDEIFEITETLENDDKYLIEINHKDKTYAFMIDKTLKKNKKIDKIEYYAYESMECILPIFKDEMVIFDVTCNNNNLLTYYHNMSDIPNGLSYFVSELSKKYEIDKFTDKSANYTKDNLLMINYDNMVDNHKVSITNYKGISIINNKIVNKNIFSTDMYNRSISMFINDYYITADYDKTYDFDKFYVVDISNGKSFEIKSNYEISFDSVIQGAIDNTLYLLDIENKRQYEVNIKNKTVKKIGNIDGVKYYYNGKWIDLSFSEAVNKEKFSSESIRNYISGDIFEDTYNNLIYTYEKENNYYKVYLSYSSTPKIKMYLFNIYNINNIKYIDDYIYFIEENELKYYSPRCGIKTILKSDELIFNKNILYTVIK